MNNANLGCLLILEIVIHVLKGADSTRHMSQKPGVVYKVYEQNYMFIHKIVITSCYYHYCIHYLISYK